jgi:hypothetical protein
LEGEFKEYDDSNIACRLMFDGVLNNLIQKGRST